MYIKEVGFFYVKDLKQVKLMTTLTRQFYEKKLKKNRALAFASSASSGQSMLVDCLRVNDHTMNDERHVYHSIKHKKLL